MEFKSQICTTKEQSERLLQLGLKKETADMYITNMSNKGINYTDDWQIGSISYCNVMSFWDSKGLQLEKTAWSIIPAWSLHRLIQMVADTQLQVGSQVGIHVEDTYDMVIQGIEWLISRGQFNKDYLEEKNDSSRTY